MDADVVMFVGVTSQTPLLYVADPVIPPHTRIIHVGCNEWEIGKNNHVDVALLGDIRKIAAQLAEAVENAGGVGAGAEKDTWASVAEASGVTPGTGAAEFFERRERRLAEIADRQKSRTHKLREELEKGRTQKPLSPAHIMAELNELWDDHTFLVDESVTTGRYVHGYLKIDRADSVIALKGGGLGYGMPTALGAQLARPDERVVAVIGDGSALYVIQALWNASKYKTRGRQDCTGDIVAPQVRARQDEWGDSEMTSRSQESNEDLNRPRLVLIEGIMGSGKTTTAQFVDETLQRMGLKTKVYLEGNLDHPADYDGVAVLEEHELEAICEAYPEYAETLRDLAERAPQSDGKAKGDDLAWSEVRVAPDEAETVSGQSHKGHTWLIGYRKAQRDMGPEAIPPALVDVLAKYDIYDGISLSKHAATLQASWLRFARGQRDSVSTSYVFDCCFLQNPGCSFIAMHNAGADALQDHVLSLANAVLPLRPVLIYLYPTNVRETLERVIPERPKEWLEFVISYHTDQEYGREHGLSGVDGLIEFLEQRQSIEIDICKQLPFPVLIVPDPHRDWSQAQADIAVFLATAVR